MNMQEAIGMLIEQSSWTKARLARHFGVTNAAIADRLRPKKTDLKVSTAQQMLDPLGYDIVVVPKGSRLPSGAILIDDAQE